MIRIAREWVVIDVPQLRMDQSANNKYMRMGIPEDASHHGFAFTKELLMAYFVRLGVPPENLNIYEYNNGLNILYKVNVKTRKRGLAGA